MSTITTCEHCNKPFNREYEKKRHQQNCKAMKNDNLPQFSCISCEKTFARKDALTSHFKKCGDSRKRKSDEPIPGTSTKVPKLLNKSEMQPSESKRRTLKRCEICDKSVTDYYGHLRSTQHKDKLSEPLEEHVECVKSSFKSRIATYRVYSERDTLTADEFMRSVKTRALKLITRNQTEVGNALKINFELFGEYVKGSDEENGDREIKSFNTKNKIVSLTDNLGDVYDSFKSEIKTMSEEFQGRNSGWTIVKVLYLEININKYSPMKGSSYFQLPKFISDKNACINVKNDDEACFFWAVVSALYPAKKNSDRINSYPKYKEVLKIDGMSLPVTLDDIKHFEEQNNISINVYEADDNSILGPIYYRSVKREKHINLLYMEKDKQSHFCWIKNLSRLIRSKMTKNGNKMWQCDGCFWRFKSEDKLLEHSEQECAHIKSVVPNPDNNKLKFNKYSNQLLAPVVVYADFESVLTPISGKSNPSQSTSYTINTQLHEPYSFGYYIKCNYDDSLSKYATYRGESCVKKFLEMLENDLRIFNEAMHTKLPMKRLTEAQKYLFSTTVNCIICKQELGNDRKHDHCHLTGEYRGAAHNNCNLKYKINKFIPVVMHNFSKYDAHFLIENLNDEYLINCIPKSQNEFLSLTITKRKDNKEYPNLNKSHVTCPLRFIDSINFLKSSLDELAKNLEESQFKNIKKYYPEHTSMMTKKGVFPYDYLESLEKLNETNLPPQACFYNKLYKRDITEEQYNQAQEIWNKFDIQTLGEYSDLYVKIDVLLLADIFENFRNICLSTYELDPAYYFSAPGLSWDAMLKTTDVEIELLTDISMLQFVKRGIRGGLSQCSGKYSEANNKYMSDYDPEKESKYIIYLDANNLYGWAMTQYLPLKDFRWLEQNEIDNFEVTQLEKDSEKGYFLEVDLKYPLELHDLHNDLPFCPENKIPERSKSNDIKLIADLTDKKNYIIHYVNLQQALAKGLELKKIHRVLTFTQSQWLKPYIEKNTLLRKESKNEFEKDFYKLLNNAVYGKTMENVEKRLDVKIVSHWENIGKRLGAAALISRPNFSSRIIINESLSIIQSKQKSVKFDKPTYIGFAVLELSKSLMYTFHYDYMNSIYRKPNRLLYTDTDSLIYELNTDDFYEDIKNDIDDWFDTSDYPTNNIFNLPLKNRKELGKFKDECKGVIITEFIGIRSKCYHIVKADGKNIKKIKGIKTSVVEDEISQEDFKDSLENKHEGNKLYREMFFIRFKKQELVTQRVNKVALSNADDKRFTISDSDSFHTMAWGHKDINKS